jgi:ubiquitin-conjugating enzyme E2 W
LRLCPYEEEELKVQRKKKGKQKKLKKTKKENLSKYSSGKFEEEEEVRPQSKGSEEKSKSKNDASTMWNYKDLKSSNPNHRIQRELKQFITSPPPNLSVKVGKNIRVWIVTMRGANNTIYEGETYRLKITFPDRYPIVPPSAYFLKPTPRHEHVYTNGDICLSLLGKDWRPTMTAQSIAVSILSILSSAKKKSLPMDNSRVAGQKPGMSQENWVYHDDNC